MAYEEYTWETGETITSEKLNHMERGITNSYDLFPIQTQLGEGTATLTKTWQEIFDAVNAGKFPYIISSESETIVAIESVVRVGAEEGSYYVEGGTITFLTDSSTGYPTYGGASN